MLPKSYSKSTLMRYHTYKLVTKYTSTRYSCFR